MEQPEKRGIPLFTQRTDTSSSEDETRPSLSREEIEERLNNTVPMPLQDKEEPPQQNKQMPGKPTPQPGSIRSIQ